MVHRTSSLGAVVIAISALSLALTALAQASEIHATTPNSASIFGQQSVGKQHLFKTTAGNATSKTATFEATATNSGPSGDQTTAPDLTITATYSESTAFGQAAQILMNGCKFTITATQVESTANVDITGCTSGKQIEVKTAICTITVPEQHHLGHAMIVDTPEPGAIPHDVHANVTLTGIKYENHGPLCPNYGGKSTEVRTDGTYTGEGTTLQARVDEGSEQVTSHSHQYNRLKQGGTLVGLTAT